MQIPAGITETKTTDGIELSFRRTRRRDIIPLAGTVFVIAVSIIDTGLSPRNTQWFVAAGALMIWAGHALVMVVNQTRIAVNPNRLRIKRVPIGLPALKEIPMTDIQDINVETHQSRFGIDASVRIEDKKGESEPLVGRLTTAKADYIAQRINEYLTIK